MPKRAQKKGRKTLKNEVKRGVEFQEARKRFQSDINSTKKILSGFLIVALALKFLARMPVSFLIFGLLITWLGAHLLREKILDRAKNAESLYRIYFLFNILDLLFLTPAVYFVGTSEWLGPTFYLFTLTMTSLLFSRKRAIAMSLIGLCFYSAVAVLEYVKVIPHHSFFPAGGPLNSIQSLGSHLLIVGIIFYLIADVVGVFSEELKQRTKELAKEKEKTSRALKRSQEWEKVLQIRVLAKTKELRDLAEKQEQEIEARTKELKQRLEELEKFRRLVVGREIKMIELKKKLRDKEKT